MKSVIEGNLVPDSIRAARRAKNTLRVWLLVCVVFAAGLVGGGVGLRVLVLGPDAGEQSAQEQLIKRDAELRDRLAQFAKVLDDVKRRTELTAQATTRPDWGLMLAALAEERHHDEDGASGVILTSCAVTELTQKDGVRVELSGLSLSQATVQQYVIDLEATGLFDEVVLIDTKRAISPGGERLAFNLAAEIVGGASRRADGETNSKNLAEGGR